MGYGSSSIAQSLIELVNTGLGQVEYTIINLDGLGN